MTMQLRTSWRTPNEQWFIDRRIDAPKPQASIVLSSLPHANVLIDQEGSLELYFRLKGSPNPEGNGALLSSNETSTWFAGYTQSKTPKLHIALGDLRWPVAKPA